MYAMYKRHPMGLWVLFLTLMWERFGHYGLKSILVLYLTANIASGGLGWSDGSASFLYGFYVMVVYTMCIPGGLVADNYLSKKQLVFAGNTILCLGHLTMALPFSWAMYPALTLIALGVGLQKPNVTVMVGQLYTEDDPAIKAQLDSILAIKRAKIEALIALGICLDKPSFVVMLRCLYKKKDLAIMKAQLNALWAEISQEAKTSEKVSVLEITALEEDFLRRHEGINLGALQAKLDSLSAKNPDFLRRYEGKNLGALQAKLDSLTALKRSKIDDLQDEGYLRFYQGINLGAFVATVLVALVANAYGWHYGFGLAGIGMLMGQLVFVLGQKHLTNVGNLPKKVKVDSETQKPKELTTTEADRMTVVFVILLLSLVFWAAFEQGGGLINLYAKRYVDRSVGGFEIPSSWVLATNPLMVMILGGWVDKKLTQRKNSGKDYSASFALGLGNICLGAGFICMWIASLQVVISPEGQIVQKAQLVWVVAAFVLITVGELCLTPVSLSYIKKLAPPEYHSFMMGLYWGVTGLGGMVAGLVGAYTEKAGHCSVFIGTAVFAAGVGFLSVYFTKILKHLEHQGEVRKEPTAVPVS